MRFYGINYSIGLRGPGHTIGSALALKNNKKCVIGVIGDGDFLMGMNALWTASHMQIPLMIVVANNRSYYNEEVHQERMAITRNRPVENKWIGQKLDNPDIDILFLNHGGPPLQGAMEVSQENLAEQVNMMLLVLPPYN